MNRENFLSSLLPAVLLPAVLLLSLPMNGGQTLAQEQSQTAAQDANARQLIQQLQVENQKLKEQLRSSSSLPSSSSNPRDTASLEDFQQGIHAQLQQLNELSNVQRELQANKQIQSKLTSEVIDQLQDEWTSLSKQQVSTASKLGTSPSDLLTAQTIAQRVAAAEIDNRLRLIEARTTVQVLGEYRSKLELYTKQHAELENQHAAILLQRRQEDLRLAQKTMAAAKDRTERKLFEVEVQSLKLSLREAELLKKEAELHVTNANRNFDTRLNEASMQVAIAERIAEALTVEKQKAIEAVDAETNLSAINGRREIVQRQIADARMSADELERTLQAKHIIVEMQLANASEELALSESKKIQLSKELGEAHPAVKAAENQIQVLKDLIREIQSNTN